jgi:hypothetical protein
MASSRPASFPESGTVGARRRLGAVQSRREGVREAVMFTRQEVRVPVEELSFGELVLSCRRDGISRAARSEVPALAGGAEDSVGVAGWLRELGVSNR